MHEYRRTAGLIPAQRIRLGRAQPRARRQRSETMKYRRVVDPAYESGVSSPSSVGMSTLTVARERLLR